MVFMVLTANNNFGVESVKWNLLMSDNKIGFSSNLWVFCDNSES